MIWDSKLKELILMKTDSPALTPRKNDDQSSWTCPVLKKGAIAAETLNGSRTGQKDGVKPHALS